MTIRRNLLVKSLLCAAAIGGAWGGYLFGNEIYGRFGEGGEHPSFKDIDELGIPNRCIGSDEACDLTEEELKEIKFKDLENSVGEVTVSNFPSGETITLKIVTDSSDNSRYIFSNGSGSEITIRRSSAEVTLGSGKTRFTVDDGALKKLETNELGLPADCNTSCQLTEDDLEQVKFKDLGEEEGEVTVTNLPYPKTITLRIDESDAAKKRYIFSNESDQEIKIQRGSEANSVSLKAKGKVKFAEEEGKLKKLVTNELGLPEGCESVCYLTPDDLEEIKFFALGEENDGDMTIAPTTLTGRVVTLRIEGRDEDGNKKYIFSNTSGEDINIQRGTDGNRAITLGTKGESKFSVEEGKLKTLELSELGLPEGCKQRSECKLTQSDLKDIKFKKLDGDGETNVTNLSSSQTITLKIETIPVTGNNKYIFINSGTNPVEIQKGAGVSKKITLGSGEKTRFIVDDSKLKDDELGEFGLPKRCETSECKLTEDDLEQIKFKALGEESGGKVSVSGLSSDKSISLRIETGHGNKKKYIFTNGTEENVVIKRGEGTGNSVTLNKKEKTRFEEDGEDLIALNLGSFGLPANCNSSCQLTEDDLEQIKFKDLGESGDSKVTNLPSGQTISLRIENGYGNKKKYIFNNSGGKEINIQRGSLESNKVTLKVGKTRFEENNNDKLKKLELGDYGLPKNCNEQCNLNEDDLELIKFEGFGESVDSKVTNLPSGQTISLKIVADGSEEKRYIFKNETENNIQITNGSREVTLNKKEKTRFEKNNNDKLKKLELGSYGLPANCNSSCQLTEDDLELIKFDGFSGEGNVSGLSAGEKISLKIVDDGSKEKRYIFNNEFENNIQITNGSREVTLNKKEKTRFIGENNKYLKQFTPGNLGLPSYCSNGECTLIEDDLEGIKFKDLEGGTGKVTISSFPPSSNALTLKIDSTDSKNKKYIFLNNSSNQITISKGNSGSLTLKVGKTKFTEEGEKLKEQKLNEYGLPATCTSECNLSEDDLKDIKFKDLEGDLTIENYPSNNPISLKIVEDSSGNSSRYIFSNGSRENVVVKKGSSSVTLKNGKTRFTLVDKKLKEITLGSYGLPSECITSNNCSLIQDDLEQIKFDGFGGEGNVSGLSAGGKISLKIVDDGTTKKYIFSNETNGEVKIKKSASDETDSVTFKSKRKTKFTENNSKDKLKKLELGNYGLPSTCNEGSQCSLTTDDLEDIKFEDLGEDSEGAVTVTSEGIAGKKITLTIETDEESKKKYIFTNSSGRDITIKRKDDPTKSVNIKSRGGTKFFEDNNKLKKLVLGDFGLPTRCTTKNSCSLSKDDLEDIKFKELEGDGEVTFDPSPTQKISLKIEDGYKNNSKKYIFNNETGQNINIKKGSETVTLGNGKTKFIKDNDKLKKVDLNEYGVPSLCSSESPCSLTANDLEEIKFKDLDGQSEKVTITPFDQSVTLRVSGSNKNKYSFFNGSSGEISIKKGTMTVSLNPGERTKFIGENNKLKKLELWDYGLPLDCKTKTECKLTIYDLEDIKYQNLGEESEGDVIVTTTDPNQEITLKIEGSEGNKTYEFENKGTHDIKITRGEKKIVIGAWRTPKFTVEGKKLKAPSSTTK